MKLETNKVNYFDSFLLEVFSITEKDLQILTHEKLKNYVIASLLAMLVGASLLSHWVPELYAWLITAGIVLMGWLKMLAILYIRSKMRQH